MEECVCQQEIVLYIFDWTLARRFWGQSVFRRGHFLGSFLADRLRSSKQSVKYSEVDMVCQQLL